MTISREIQYFAGRNLFVDSSGVGNMAIYRHSETSWKIDQTETSWKLYGDILNGLKLFAAAKTLVLND